MNLHFQLFQFCYIVLASGSCLFFRFPTLLPSFVQHLSVFFFSPNFRSVSASKFSNYFAFNSCLCCFLFWRSSKRYRYALLADTVLFYAKWLPTSESWLSNVLSNLACLLSPDLSWRLAVLQLSMHIGVLFSDRHDFFLVNKLIRIFVSVRVVSWVVRPKVAVAQESKRNQNITSWLFSVTFRLGASLGLVD